MNEPVKSLRSLLKGHDIYVQAIIPTDVIENGAQGEYSPWYLAHSDSAMLSQRSIDHLWTEYRDAETRKSDGDRADPCEAMQDFFQSIEKLGYICLHSADAPVVTINRDE
ncbi:MAG TPA: hypothetical protein VGP72_21335 [Planctomycetota bacterium]|jgi:hypothetical protein